MEEAVSLSGPTTQILRWAEAHFSMNVQEKNQSRELGFQVFHTEELFACEREMSKKNDLGRRKRLHEFELKREKEEKEKKAKKLQAKKNKMKVDGNDKKNKKKGAGGFQVGKRKLKTKLTALAKAKAAQAMEVDK